jgi:hypothetical protein
MRMCHGPDYEEYEDYVNCLKTMFRMHIDLLREGLTDEEIKHEFTDETLKREFVDTIWETIKDVKVNEFELELEV